MESTERMTEIGKTDDGGGEYIVSSNFAERTLLNGIWNVSKIDKVFL